MRLLVTLGVAALLAACGAPDAVGTGVLSLGTTLADGSGFVPLTGDQTLVPGAQGGFHIWLKLRVEGMPAGKLAIARTARRVSDDRLLLQAQGELEIGEPNGDGMWELPTPFTTFLCPSPLGVNILEEPVRFKVVLSQEAGPELGTADTVATPHCPTDAQAAFCERICSGN